MIPMYEDDFVMKIKIEIPKKEYNDFGSITTRNYETEVVEKWKTFVLLTLPGYLKFGHILIFTDDWPLIYWQAVGPYGIALPAYPDQWIVPIDKATVLKINKAKKIFSDPKLSKNLEKKIGYSIERLEKAKSSFNLDDIIVELSIALEFLINTTNNEVTLQLSLKLIKLLYERNVDEQLFINIKKFYDLRSKIVHGNEKPKGDEVNRKLLFFIEQLIQNATLRLIALNQKYSYKLIDKSLIKALHLSKSLNEILNSESI
jgi:hypothetical protein